MNWVFDGCGLRFWMVIQLMAASVTPPMTAPTTRTVGWISRSNRRVSSGIPASAATSAGTIVDANSERTPMKSESSCNAFQGESDTQTTLITVW